MAAPTPVSGPAAGDAPRGALAPGAPGRRDGGARLGPWRGAAGAPWADERELRLAALARAGAPLRRALARLAARWVATGGWQALGFARLRDHAAERLGLSARQVHELARMDAALGALPRVEAAQLAGRLSWTKARLVARAGAPGDERRWIALAERLPSEALEHEVRAVDRRSVDRGGAGRLRGRAAGARTPAGVGAGECAPTSKGANEGTACCASAGVGASVGAVECAPSGQGANEGPVECASAGVGTAEDARARDGAAECAPPSEAANEGAAERAPAGVGASVGAAECAPASDGAAERALAGGAAMECAPAGDPGPEPEPRETVRLRCSPRTRAKLWHVRQVARRMAGERLPPWAAMEAMAAETLSAVRLEVHPELPPAGGALAEPGGGGAQEAASVEGAGIGGAPDPERGPPQEEAGRAGAAAPPRAASATPRADAFALAGAPGMSARSETSQRAGASDGTPAPDEAGARETSAHSGASQRAGACDAAPALREAGDAGEADASPAAAGPAGSPAAYPRFVAALTADLEALDARALEARLRRAVRCEQRLLARMGPLLAAVASERLYRDLGYRSLDAYARERLGLAPDRAHALLRLERAGAAAPALARAWRRGRVGWSRAQALAPLAALAHARPHHEAWLARAECVTVQRLEEDVELALARDDPDPAHLPELPVFPGARGVVGTDAGPRTGDRAGIRAHSKGRSKGDGHRGIDAQPDAPAGLGIRAQPRAPEEDTRSAAPAPSSLPAGLGIRARATVADEDPRPAGLRRREPVRYFFTAPRSVARLFRATLATVQRRIERAHGRPSSEDEALEAMCDHAIATWDDRPLRRGPKEVAVFARDGWRCTAPGCSSFRNLHDHHIVYRSAQGSEALANRTTLCAWHHLRGEHAGRIRVTGRAPGRLRFAMPFGTYGSGGRRLAGPGS